MSFGDQVAAFGKLAVARADGAARAAVEETGRRLIDRSPVRTGHFRANWQLGEGVAPGGELPIAGAPGNPAPPPEIPEIAASEAGRRFFWVNHAGYGSDLEVGRNGHRPLGLLALASIEWPALVAKVAK